MPEYVSRFWAGGDPTKSKLVGAGLSPLLIWSAWDSIGLLVLSVAISGILFALAVGQIRSNLRRFGRWHPDA